MHSDLGIVNRPTYGGELYVLIVVDEKSDEVIPYLLKLKDAATVLSKCKYAHTIVSARTANKLKAWQFDRGPEFLNAISIIGLWRSLVPSSCLATSNIHGRMGELSARLVPFLARHGPC